MILDSSSNFCKEVLRIFTVDKFFSFSDRHLAKGTTFEHGSFTS